MKKITALLLMAVMVFGIFTPSIPAFAAGGAENYPLNSIVIKIEDIVTHQMLGGARFEIYYSNEAVSGGSVDGMAADVCISSYAGTLIFSVSLIFP